MSLILKRKDFARWQSAEKLPDSALCKTVEEMESGLIDADLGGMLYKKRIARPGSGKSGGFRTLLSARVGDRYVFLHGFAKNDRANITQDEKKALQYAGKVFLELPAHALSKALGSGVLLEGCIVSKIIESLRDDLVTLHNVGAIDKVTMREFDAVCPPPVRDLKPSDIKSLREKLKFSQPVFAHHLHTTASTVRKWEQGDTRPTGPALKLLNVIADKGLQAIL